MKEGKKAGKEGGRKEGEQKWNKGGKSRKRKKKEGGNEEGRGRLIGFMVSEAVVHHGEEGLGYSREVHRTATKKERGWRGIGREGEGGKRERQLFLASLIFPLFHPGPRLWGGAAHIQGTLPHLVHLLRKHFRNTQRCP